MSVAAHDPRRARLRRLQRRIAGALVLLLACGGQEPAPAPKGKGAKAAAKPQPAPAAAPVATAPAPRPDTSPPPPQIKRLVELEEALRTRDPFQSFASTFAEESKKRVRSQREVVLHEYALDDLKLSALITRISPSRAMLVDPTGRGHMVLEGQFIGRAELVQGGTNGTDYEINWRIDRIRDGDIVLVREDPSNPDVPSATRVIPLRPEEAATGPGKPHG
jgi:type IV pilus assembly protein PilP